MSRTIIKTMSIRKKLILSYLLACVVPLICSGLIIYKVSADSLEETAFELASIFSSQIVTNIDNVIDEYDRVTKIVLVDSDIINKFDDSRITSVTERVNYQLALRKIMMRLVTMKPEIKNICFLSAADQFYQYNTENSYIDKERMKEQEWLEKLISTDQRLVISSVHDRNYYDRNQDGIVITVGRKILDNKGAYSGLLLIDFDPASLIELSEGFLLARNQYNVKISITDSENGILYDSDVASGRVTWEEAMSQESLLLNQKSHQDYIILTSETKRAGLSVNVVIPRSNLLFKINNVSLVTGGAILVCTLVVILTSTFFSKMITSPIGKLQRRMRQAEEGEYKELIENDSDDEIGDLITSYNRMVVRIKTLIEDVYLAEIKQKNARYLALKTQINPHMLYNTLEAIRMKALVKGADEVADMIKILARMFRLSLNDSTALHTIQDEADYAENYIKLQNMRFPDLFFLDFGLSEKIKSASIISMVLQPIIENCIEHGLRGILIPLHIAVKGELKDSGDIVIQISDDGKGMSQECMDRINRLISQTEKDKWKQEEESEKGIGLINITERIMLYYGESYYLKVTDSGNEGTIIEICIPGQWEEM